MLGAAPLLLQILVQSMSFESSKGTPEHFDVHFLGTDAALPMLGDYSRDHHRAWSDPEVKLQINAFARQVRALAQAHQQPQGADAPAV